MATARAFSTTSLTQAAISFSASRLDSAAVLVGLLVGQAQELLDLAAEARRVGWARSRRALVCSVTLRSSSLMWSLPVVPVLARDAQGVGQLLDAGVQPLDEHVDLRARSYLRRTMVKSGVPPAVDGEDVVPMAFHHVRRCAADVPPRVGTGGFLPVLVPRGARSTAN